MGHTVRFQEIVKEDIAVIREKLACSSTLLLLRFMIIYDSLHDHLDLEQLTDVDVIVTSGGTGISLRDSAFEMVSEILAKKIDGFGELFRMVLFPFLSFLFLLFLATFYSSYCLCSSRMRRWGQLRC
jgi:molybdopterin biosynthesis enzyme MoaB